MTISSIAQAHGPALLEQAIGSALQFEERSSQLDAAGIKLGAKLVDQWMGQKSHVLTANYDTLVENDEWLSLFDDPILRNGALDRLANASYRIVIEGTSYRERLSPRRALLSNEGGD